MKKENEHNFVNHIMAGETRFRIESPFDDDDKNGEYTLKFHWSPKGVPGEEGPHFIRFPQIEK